MKFEKNTRRERGLNPSTESIVSPKSTNNTQGKKGKKKKQVDIVYSNFSRYSSINDEPQEERSCLRRQVK